LVTVIEAFETTAPEASVTVPVIVPVSNWASIGRVLKAKAASRTSRCKAPVVHFVVENCAFRVMAMVPRARKFHSEVVGMQNRSPNRKADIEQ
jgi:hypothetical protein